MLSNGLTLCWLSGERHICAVLKICFSFIQRRRILRTCCHLCTYLVLSAVQCSVVGSGMLSRAFYCRVQFPIHDSWFLFYSHIQTLVAEALAFHVLGFRRESKWTLYVVTDEPAGMVEEFERDGVVREWMAFQKRGIFLWK